MVVAAQERSKPFAAPKKPSATEAWDSGSLPVVCVRKMAAKGCAIVLLRSGEVLERSVQQRVAVVDGVCVEVRRHKSNSTRDEFDAIGGVFVAWGHRVERRVPVSEAGLEAYFNGLAGAPVPQGLSPELPFKEELQCFPLVSRGAIPPDVAVRADDPAPERMLEGPHHSPHLVRELWEAKERLDAIWSKPPPPMGRSICQRVARDQLFPLGKEGKDHENRAGDKLAELVSAMGLLEGVPAGAAFLDLCGGPGAWSQLLLGRRDLGLRGFGLTLRSGEGGAGSAGDWQAEEKDDWYRELLGRPDWRAVWGRDGTGDLLQPGNVESAAGEIRGAGGVFLCVADGGFSDASMPPNLLELYFSQLLIAELLTVVSCLQPGGRFVCKLYSAFSAATTAVLFLVTRLFREVKVVKPVTSRVAGPERYLVAFGYQHNSETEAIRRALLHAHKLGTSPPRPDLLTPLVSIAALERQEGEFMEMMRTMVVSLCGRQAGALRAILNRAEFLEEMALDAARHAEASPLSVAPVTSDAHAPSTPRMVRAEQRAPGGRHGWGRPGEKPGQNRAEGSASRARQGGKGPHRPPGAPRGGGDEPTQAFTSFRAKFFGA